MAIKDLVLHTPQSGEWGPVCLYTVATQSLSSEQGYMLYWEENGKSSAKTELSHRIVDTVKQMYKKSLQILVATLPGTLPGQ